MSEDEQWKKIQQDTRSLLEKIDQLVDKIESGQLTGIDAATDLQLVTRSAQFDAFTGSVLYPEKAKHSDSKEFWEYALNQAEKARDAFDIIQEVPTDRTEAEIFKGQRANCDDHVQFFRRALLSPRAAIKESSGQGNPHVGRG